MLQKAVDCFYKLFFLYGTDFPFFSQNIQATTFYSLN